MASTETVDPYIAVALKLLHSSAPDSAEKLRTMLDNEIQKNHDKSKLITNLLTKKQLTDEKNAPGSGFKKIKQKKPEEVKVIKQPEIIPILDDDSSSAKKSENDDDMNIDEQSFIDDLYCVTCRQIDSSANNQLFECIECHSLHHQLCHNPKISNEANLTSWVCSSCKSKKEKEGSSKSTKSYESSSSSSSSSSHKKPKIDTDTEKKTETTKKKPKESSSSSSSSRSRSSKK